MAPEAGLELTTPKFPNELGPFWREFQANQAKPTVIDLTQFKQSGVNSGVSSKQPFSQNPSRADRI